MDGDIGPQHFAAWFDFVRPAAAPARNAAGALVTIAAGQPRFDHDAEGRPLGLLIEPGAALGQADRARLQDAAIGAVRATVLHAIAPLGGGLHRRAYYTSDPQAMVDACLGLAGRHRSIAVIPGFRTNLGGFVRYRGLDWHLVRRIGDGTGPVGDEAGRALIDG